MEHNVVAVILRRDDEILLCHRSPTRRWYPDVWDFPGGHIEPGEDPQAALRREVAEELGAALHHVEGDPVLHRIVPDTGLDLTVWASRRWQGPITNRQPEEHDAIGWVTAAPLAPPRFSDPPYLGVLQRLLRT